MQLRAARACYGASSRDECTSELRRCVQVEMQVQLSRDASGGPVIAPQFPGTKEEFWWLICGDDSDNVLAIKRFSFDKQHKAKLVIDNFKPGNNTFKLLLMCDSYLGCDQEYPFDVSVTGGEQAGGAADMDAD